VPAAPLPWPAVTDSSLSRQKFAGSTGVVLGGVVGVAVVVAGGAVVAGAELVGGGADEVALADGETEAAEEPHAATSVKADATARPVAAHTRREDTLR
jgi:hypothetical protein